MTKVQCRCGAVEVEITGEPIVQFFCHCDDCQAVHGGAYVPESAYAADSVKVTRGAPLTWSNDLSSLANVNRPRANR